MSILLLKQRMSAELASLEQLLDRTPRNDIVGRIGLESRVGDLRAKIAEYADHHSTRAEVALVFSGKPVVGSSAIQAPFTTKALEAFQRAVATSYALHGVGPVGQRGPIAAADLSALHITGLVHGSFGFVLEELDPIGPQFLDSALKQAADEVVDLLARVSSEDDETAQQTIDDINSRIFSNLRDLVKFMYDNEAGIKISQPERETELSGVSLRRAYGRIVDVSIDDSEIVLHGILEGILPAARRFEFRAGSTFIRGKVSKDITEDYLRTIETAPLVGRTITGTFIKRVLADSSGSERTSYLLVKVIPEEGAPSHAM